MADAKRLELLWEVDPELSIDAEGDDVRLGQALWNLLVNAVKFTESGSVAMRAGATREPDSCVVVRFEIRDTGIGVSPEAHDRIFEPFVQADGSRIRRYQGIGLGLPIARHLAGLMGGDIEVRSLPGIGSTFILTARLRIARDAAISGGVSARSPIPDERAAPAASHPLDATASVMPRGVRILIVDDSDVNREVLAELLSCSGADLAVAENGREAVRMAQHARYDMVLMDVQMPEMDGLEATRRIRALPGWTDVPIVAVTTHVFPEDRVACLAAGMNDHLAKPVEPTALYGVLARWLRQGNPSAIDIKDSRMDTIEAPATIESDLHRIPGLVAADGIRHVGGDAARLRRFLVRFRQEHASAAGQVRELVADGDRASAARRAHTVKGLCATLGLAELSELARALERALASEGGGSGAAELARFETALDRTCEAILALAAPTSAGEVTSRSAVAAD